ncbi:MAG: hypothetical protein ACP5UZ_07535 [Thermoplasmata archaeon]
MTEPKSRYPTLEGSVRVTLKGGNFTVKFEDRTISIVGNENDFKATIPSFRIKVSGTGEVRKIAKIVSNLGFTIRLEDSKGPIVSFGKGIWSPIGHFSFKPRIRKYLKRDK